MARVVEKARALRIAELPPFPGSDELDHQRLVAAWCQAGMPLWEAARAACWGIAPIRGGAITEGQVLLQNTPVDVPFVIDPAAFFPRTEENFFRHQTVAYSAGNPWNPVILPQVGVYGKIVLQFVGTVTVGVAAGTTRALWPYGILDSIAFKANGQDELFSSQGIALKALERTRYPYLTGQGDDLVGPGIGAGLTLPIGASDVRLTYEIPIAFDPVSLVGGLFAQSKAMNLTLQGRDGTVADVATVGGGGTVTIAGTWHVGIELYQIPPGPRGEMILPDVRALHFFNEVVTNHANTGDVKSPFTRTHGQLMRVLTQNVQDSANPRDFYSPAAADVDEYRLEFGANKRPYIFTPAQFLLSANVRDYGAALPYSYIALDFVRYNAPRDSVMLTGVTELYWVTQIDAGAAPVNGQQRVCQEVLVA